MGVGRLWFFVGLLACGPSEGELEAEPASDPSTGSSDPVTDPVLASSESSSETSSESDEWEACYEVGEASPICVSPITDGGDIGFGESRWHFTAEHTHPWEEGLIVGYNDEEGSPLFEVYRSDSCAPLDGSDVQSCVLEVRLMAGDEDRRYDLSDRCNCTDGDAANDPADADAAPQPVRRAGDCSCCALTGGANRGPEVNRQRREAYQQCIANGGGCGGGCPRPASRPRR